MTYIPPGITYPEIQKIADERDALRDRVDELSRAYAVQGLAIEELTAERDALRARVAELEAWQITIAEGTAFINRAEGQDGYEVASPQTILSFFEEIAHTLNRYRAALEEIANPDPNALAHHTVARLALEG